MTRQGTNVTRIAGDVFVIEGTTKERVDEFIKIDDVAKVETGPSSYAGLSDNPSPESNNQGSGAILFPESKIQVQVKGGFIEKIEVEEGLVNLWLASEKSGVTPYAEFVGPIWVDVAPDGRTIIAGGREAVYNRKTGKAATLSEDQQVLVTEEEIGQPEPMDQRFHRAKKILFDLGVFTASDMYRQVVEGSDAMLKASLAALESLSEQTGQDIKELKEEAIRDFAKHKEWAKGEMDKSQQEGEKIKRADFSASSTIPINRSIKYQDLDIKIISVKRDSKGSGSDLLSMEVEAKNTSENQVFIFWNEEARLIDEKGETHLTDDYDLETSFSAQSSAKGYLFIPIYGEVKRFKLQLGKMSLPKIEMELDLSLNSA